jgi:hypothetical protein
MANRDVNDSMAVTTEYLDFPGGVKHPFIARSDKARRMIAMRNRSVLTEGWIHGSTDEINAAIDSDEGFSSLKWVH